MAWGVALPQDALAPATNPAGISFLPSRADVGGPWFKVDRGASLGGGSLDGNQSSSTWANRTTCSKQATTFRAIAEQVGEAKECTPGALEVPWKRAGLPENTAARAMSSISSPRLFY